MQFYNVCCSVRKEEEEIKQASDIKVEDGHVR
jgi:hypothetical protein